MTFIPQKHVEFLRNKEKENENDIESITSSHLKICGIYWGITTLHLLNQVTEEDKERLSQFCMKCFDEKTGGFGGNIGYDGHIYNTLSAIQVLCILGKRSLIPVEQVANFIKSCQREDGSFVADHWGESDNRFVYCAVLALTLIGKLDVINTEAAVNYLMKCMNFDGAFGCIPGAESHAGQTFTVVACLALLNRLDVLDKEKLAWWLCERQTATGGLNGRPEKLPDVCYSWWVLTSLIILGKVDWIDKDALEKFILQAQDMEDGGIADRPGDCADIYHTYFGIAGLSLMRKYTDIIGEIDPRFAMPKDVLEFYHLI
ncbi:geranylgeranyl transferase type-2 subunit beta, putative [Entamoeba dispar SAW760]|uniref:Geranylgeranyl transferase type-2 subunit beta n=1 Tax=Entamoeba dispar (strain ATCC PRA-260 / SAW760) TaxID=370354 RepID=B0ERG8_ENTDS|nr:geranylgeranyl transferase type-2 subunit beta, putative [Entamoeba dispar SAW760]EDR22868.1 geranylgeranyl transferase type-2 subunit beta, putative [Entamoeba dispar SAW760]|eukprot:EDR22868.1 geranylgeranyl transferase type-2 subunit beta, putative [Entamoeba dispar SAW760]